MIDNLIQQLNDLNPEVRRRAVIALGKAKDMAALSALADVFRSDPDPDLRELARKAGIYIRQQNADAAPPRTTPPPRSAEIPSQARRRSLADLAAQARGEAEDSDIRAARQLEQLRARREDSPSQARRHSLADLAAQARGETEDSDIRAARRIEQMREQDELDGEPARPNPPSSRRRRGERASSWAGRRQPIADPTDDDLNAYLADAPAQAPPPRRRGEAAAAAAGGAAGIAGGVRLGDDGEVDNAPGARPISLEDYGFVRGKEYKVTPDDRERARKQVDSAMTMSMEGKNDKAVKTLALALKLNPNLINDGFFNSVASTVTNEDGDAAIAVLVSGERRAAVMKTHQKDAQKKRVEKHMEKISEGSTSGLAFEVIVYMLINSLFPVIILLVLVQSFVNLAGQIILSLSETPDYAQASAALEEVQLAATSLSQNIIIVLLAAAVGAAIGGIFALGINSVITHLIANLLGGKGRLVYQLTQVTAVYNKYMPAYYIVLTVIVALVFVVFPWPLLCGVLVLPLGALFISFKTAEKVGESYSFGTGLGCVAFAIANLLTYIIYGLAGVLLNSIVSSAIESLIQTAPV